LELACRKAVAAFAAVDCTYYVMPKPMDEDFETLYYTGYKKIHGIKFTVICCIMSGRILHVAASPASVTDPTAFEAHQQHMIADGCAVLGDKAYEGIDKVVSPIKESSLLALRLVCKYSRSGSAAHAHLVACLEYNAGIGKYRINIEQAIGELKGWAAARGQPRCRLVCDTAVVLERVKVVASLCNFLQDVRRRGVPAAVRGDVLSDKRRRNKRGRDDDWYLPVIESVTRQRL
jgi:hypothetical protein